MNKEQVEWLHDCLSRKLGGLARCFQEQTFIVWRTILMSMSRPMRAMAMATMTVKTRVMISFWRCCKEYRTLKERQNALVMENCHEIGPEEI
jgi:hypothetical protein